MNNSIFSTPIRILPQLSRAIFDTQRAKGRNLLSTSQWLHTHARNSSGYNPYTISLLQNSCAIKGNSKYSIHTIRPFSTDQTSARSMKRDIEEYTMRAKAGNDTNFDEVTISPENASIFPRIKTTSLSTKCIIIHDEAKLKPVTLVLVAFRSFADDQLHSWRDIFTKELKENGQWFDVTVNESFSAQALSGFVQRWQRGRTDPHLHDYYVAFNSRAREPLERLLYTENRMYGNVLLLDRDARVRFRASGAATEDGMKSLISCARAITKEDIKST